MCVAFAELICYLAVKFYFWIFYDRGHMITSTLTLHGKAFTLRPVRASDYPALQKILSDPKTMQELKFMSHAEHGGWTLDEIRQRYEMFEAKQRQQEGLSFIIELKNAKIAGHCGLKNLSLVKKKAEFGIILHHPYWGQGLGLDCLRLCLEYAFEKLGLEQIEFSTLLSNRRAQNALTKLGMASPSHDKGCSALGGEQTDEESYHYVMTRKDWEKKHNLSHNLK